MDPAARYLRIPYGYGARLGGLHWSAAGDAVAAGDLSTFALGPEISLFLQGFASADRPLVHFAHALHLLAMLGRGRHLPTAAGEVPAEIGRLTAAMRGAKAAGGRLTRNAGALCGHLCRNIPAAAGPPDPEAVCRLLLSAPAMAARVAEWDAARRAAPDDPTWVGPVAGEAELPSLSYEEFAARVAAALARLSDGDLRHWLSHGTGPQDARAGDRIAAQLAAVRPPNLAGVFAGLAGRPRLAGAMPFVAQLVAALSLPARRWHERALPMGGYADITTRGRPEHLLPTQFGLEPDEFVRRFSENELLYFRREEPHSRLREEIVLLLDQGVRTWGEVRLLLTAAAMALARSAGKTGTPLRLATTGRPRDLVDPLAVEPERLAGLLEGADLSAHPADALERVLSDNPAAARDVVLLTHPRNLAEPDVAAAARRASGPVRLFTVAADSAGAVRFDELRRGAAVTLARIAVSAPAAGEARPARDPGGLWSGDAEPVPFPFRFGFAGKVVRRRFDFSGDGRHLLAVGHHGVPWLLDLDSGAAEPLPRGAAEGRVLCEPEAVVGVAGGFAVCGPLAGRPAAAHYDLAGRLVRVRRPAPADSPLARQPAGPLAWSYSPEHHSVVGRHRAGVIAVDLATGESWGRPGAAAGPVLGRAEQAALDALRSAEPAPWLQLLHDSDTFSRDGETLHLDRTRGTLSLGGTKPAWRPAVPRADGRPALAGATLRAAQRRGDCLAVLSFGGRPPGVTLRVFRGPEGAVLQEFGGLADDPVFMLSPDGRHVAREIGIGRLGVFDCQAGPTPVRRMAAGRFHHDLEIALGDSRLQATVGKNAHVVRWDAGPLRHWHLPDGVDPESRAVLTTVRRPVRLPPMLEGGAGRFHEAVGNQSGLLAAADVFGQVAILDKARRLTAMMFFYRGRMAAWLPDGTRFGPPDFLGAPETADASLRIAEALRRAEGTG